MPRIPMGNEAGLGEARYQRTVETPQLGRPVQQEVGPSKQVTRMDVVDKKAAPLSQIKPVVPGPGAGEAIHFGLESLSHRADQFAAIRAQEVRQVNDAADKTSLLVQMGDQKAAYRQNTLDIINHPEMPREEKAENLKKLEDDFRATIGQAKPEYQPVVASEVMGTIASVQNTAQEVFLRNQQDSIKSDLEKRGQQLTLDAASSGDIPGALAHFDALAGAYKSAGLTQAHYEADRQKFEQGILQNDIMGQVKSLDVKSGAPALEAVNSLLARLTEADGQNVPKNWTRLDPHTRNADIAAVLQKKHQIESDMVTGANQALTKLKSDFSVGMSYYSDALKNGDPIDPKVSIALRQQAQAMMQLDPDKSAGVMGLLQLQKTEQQYGPSYRNAEAAKDPLFGTGVRPISFEDVGSPQALQAKFSENIKVGQSVKAAKGLTFVPVLRNADMEGIAKTIEAQPANGIRLIATLKNALGQDGTSSLTYIAGQMANSKDPAAPAVAAIIYNVAKGDMNTARAVADGMETVRNKAITMPKEADFRDQFNRLLGDAMADNSANRGVVFESYKTVYAGMAARKNIVDGNFDKETASEAFRRTVGGVTKWNGSSVVLPDDMDEPKFRDYMNSISPETVQAWGGVHGMTNERAAEFLQDDAQLRAVSPGRYSVLYEGRLAVTTAGRPFIIDVNQPIVKPRKSEADVIISQLSTGL